VTRNEEFVIRRQRTLISRSGRPETFELVTTAPTRYLSLLWPRNDDVNALFRMLLLPVRIVPVALLWATSTPLRLLIAAVVGLVCAVALAR